MENPEKVEAVYGGTPPELTDVRIHEVVLHRDGPALRVRLDLSVYPEQPPRKWAVQGFNTVQIEITFSGLRAVSLEGFSTDVTADIALREEGGVRVDISSGETRVEAVAGTAFISNMTAYVDAA
ncbi:MAG: hypothetical protein HOZ81_43205 [Streptomyces sp.]|nr:hypothetical protein [Streptomyces sp.]